MAEIDVFHQLHCLNALRKALVMNYDYYWGAKWGFEPPLMFTTHLEHCMDILRQNIMCHSDVDAITVSTQIMLIYHVDLPCSFHLVQLGCRSERTVSRLCGTQDLS